MDIIINNEESITINYPRRLLKRLRWVFLASLFGWVIFGMVFPFSLTTPWSENIVNLIQGGLFITQILSLLLFLVLLTESLDTPLDRVVFNKLAGEAKITKRVLWQLWMPKDTTLPLKNIDLLLIKSHNQKMNLTLKLRNGKKISLGDVSEKENLIKIAEQASLFLLIPLKIQLGGHDIYYYSKQMAAIQAVSCPQCGGFFSEIEDNQRQIRCDYCGTVSIISWKDQNIIVELL